MATLTSTTAAPTDLTGKTCLVTGVNGGIGEATAAHFAALGARVLATDVADAFCGGADVEYRPFDLLSDEGLNDCCAWIAEGPAGPSSRGNPTPQLRGVLLTLRHRGRLPGA